MSRLRLLEILSAALVLGCACPSVPVTLPAPEQTPEERSWPLNPSSS